MSRLIFLLEEFSMRVLLEGMLPRLFPKLPFLCISHEGRQDLEKSIPRKLRAWREPGVRFMVIRDNDGGDCRLLKDRLLSICREAGRGETMVRIACQELEAWYLAEPAALAKAFRKPNLIDIGGKAAFREPDTIARPSNELTRLIPEFQKVSAARRMAACLTRENNRSQSFQTLLRAIDQAASRLLQI